MSVSEEHVEPALAFVVVPDAFLVRVSPVLVPGPVTLEDLVCRPEGEFGGFDRKVLVTPARGVDVAEDVPGAE